MQNQELWKNQHRAFMDGIVIIPKLSKNERKKRIANWESLWPKLEVDFFWEKILVNWEGYWPNISFEDDFYINENWYYEKPVFQVGEKVKCSVHYNVTRNSIISIVVLKK